MSSSVVLWDEKPSPWLSFWPLLIALFLCAWFFFCSRAVFNLHTGASALCSAALFMIIATQALLGIKGVSYELSWAGVRAIKNGEVTAFIDRRNVLDIQISEPWWLRRFGVRAVTVLSSQPGEPPLRMLGIRDTQAFRHILLHIINKEMDERSPTSP